MKSPVSCKSRAMSRCSKPDCVPVKATSKRREYCRASARLKKKSSSPSKKSANKTITVDAGSLDDVLKSATDSSRKELNLRARQLVKNLLENSIARLKTSEWNRFKISKRMILLKSKLLHGLKTSESKASHITQKLDFLAATLLAATSFHTYHSKKVITAENILDVFKKDSALNEFFTLQSPCRGIKC